MLSLTSAFESISNYFETTGLSDLFQPNLRLTVVSQSRDALQVLKKNSIGGNRAFIMLKWSEFKVSKV